MVVDGSGSVKQANFNKVKEFIQSLITRIDIGPDKTQVALMQFGEKGDTKIELNLGEKTTLEQVIHGVKEMEYLESAGTHTSDALCKSGKNVRLHLEKTSTQYMFTSSSLLFMHMTRKITQRFLAIIPINRRCLRNIF